MEFEEICAPGTGAKGEKARNGHNADSTAMMKSERVRARWVIFGGKETETDLLD